LIWAGLGAIGDTLVHFPEAKLLAAVRFNAKFVVRRDHRIA
jgi:hypothetical protein